MSTILLAQLRRNVSGVLSVVLLVAAAARLAFLNTEEFRHIASARMRIAHRPSWASLTTPGPDGRASTHTASQRFAVLFVIRSSALKEDVAYWNQVAELAAPVGAETIRFLGICDEGHSCSSQNRSYFQIHGFLEPYQMRAVALTPDQALLYRDERFLAAVSRGSVPETTAAVLVEQAR